MSQENVDLVRRVLGLFNLRDVDGAMEAAHEDVEMDWSSSIGPLHGVYRGRQQVREAWASFLDAWREVRWEPEEIIDVGDARLVVLTRARMRGLGSGADVEATAAQVWTVTEGRLKSVKLFDSRDAALEAVGLGE